MFEYQTSNSLIRLNSRQSSTNNSQNRLFYKALFLCIIFSYTSTSVEAQSSYQCEFYDNGIAVSNKNSTQVPIFGPVIGYEWETNRYPNRFFADEWPWPKNPKYTLRNDDQEWMVLNPKTNKEMKWRNGESQWECSEMLIPSSNDFDDKSHVTINCSSAASFGTFDLVKFDLKQLTATAAYVISNQVIADFGLCKKLM